MDNSLSKKATTIISGIVTAFIPSVLLLIINSSIYYFNKENINISISESTYINGNYNTCVAIKNYQKNKSIDTIKFWVNEGEIDTIDTDLKNTYNDKSIILEEIIPEYKGMTIIYSNKPIDSKNFKIETNTKSNIVFLSEQKESAYINIAEYAVIAFIYFITISFVNIYFKLKQDQKISEVKESLKKAEEQIKQVEEYSKESNNQNKKYRIKYIKIIKDYSKELDFWRDTIRKILYRSSKKQLEDVDIFKEVTLNLKTYKTMEKCNYNDLNDILDNQDEKE